MNPDQPLLSTTRPHPGRAGHPPELRERATELRRAGVGRAAIARELGIGFSTVARWFREDGVPSRTDSVRGRELARASYRRTVDERWAHQQVEQDLSRDAVGPLTGRELLLIGAALYWAEGAKAKPWRRQHKVRFMNSDVTMIRVFLALVDHLGVPRERIACAVSIHESADVAAATEHWRRVVGPAPRFLAPMIKRHNPTTTRLNTGDGYHGCLLVAVGDSAPLYRHLAGTWEGVAAACAVTGPPWSTGQDTAL